MAERIPVEVEERGGVHSFRTGRGQVSLSFPEQTVVRVTGSGYLGTEMLEPVLAAVEAGLAARPPVDVFCDGRGIEGYDPHVRKALTQWTRENKDRLITVNVLATNNIVNMGVTVANLRLSGFVWTWDDADQFETEIGYRELECRRGLPRRERRPPGGR